MSSYHSFFYVQTFEKVMLYYNRSLSDFVAPIGILYYLMPKLKSSNFGQIAPYVMSSVLHMQLKDTEWEHRNLAVKGTLCDTKVYSDKEFDWISPWADIIHRK